MAKYLYALKSLQYGTPSGTSGMPGLTTLPGTVKGSVTIEEGEGTIQNFWEDQKKELIRVVKSEEGVLTFTAQFYDTSGTYLAAFKGGAGDANTYTPSTDYVTVNKAIRASFDSGDVMDIYNGSCIARLTGGGGRDKMLAWELKITPQVCTDGSPAYKITFAV